MIDLTAPPPSHSPWQRFYGAVLAERRRRGGRQRLDALTWSVGNLHWGGGGKTPLVAEIGRQLLELGASVCVLSRGYGRSGREPRLVSRGDGPLCSAFEAGDEPHLLARTVPGLAVAVASQRYDAGRLALRELAAAPDVFLLDDGFSHVRLDRDLDVLAFPAADPFARGRLLPSGRLREPLSASRFAAAAVLTGLAPASGDAPEERGRDLQKALEPHGFGGTGFATERVAQVDAGIGRALLVSGVARPEGVEASAASCGVEVVEHLAFGDHHAFPESSLKRIRDRRYAHGNVPVLATSKDWGKLTGRLEAEVAELTIRCRTTAGFRDWIEQRLNDGRVGRGAAPQPPPE
ncbi:MAG: tetraacyldisaccharide 4'-kinase [Acidobacteriota bacterium]